VISKKGFVLPPGSWRSRLWIVEKGPALQGQEGASLLACFCITVLCRAAYLDSPLCRTRSGFKRYSRMSARCKRRRDRRSLCSSPELQVPKSICCNYFTVHSCPTVGQDCAVFKGLDFDPMITVQFLNLILPSSVYLEISNRHAILTGAVARVKRRIHTGHNSSAPSFAAGTRAGRTARAHSGELTVFVTVEG